MIGTVVVRMSYADNSELQEFLRLRNPRCQHSSTLESFLIKPIQRVLKYPLLLGQLVQLAPDFTDEHSQLQGARVLLVECVLFNKMQTGVYDCHKQSSHQLQVLLC